METENNMMGGETKSEGGIGAVMGIILIIIVLLAGAWYFLAQRSDRLEKQNPAINESSMSTSTETSDIEADLGKINIGSLDWE